MFNVSPLRTTLDKVDESNFFSVTGNSYDLWFKTKQYSKVTLTHNPNTMIICVNLVTGEITALAASSEVFKVYYIENTIQCEPYINKSGQCPQS
jgi:hypothetical protein